MILKAEQEFVGPRSGRKEEKNVPRRRHSICKGRVGTKHCVWGRNEGSAMESGQEQWAREQEGDLRPDCGRPLVPSEGVGALSCGKQEATWRA